MSGPKKSRWQIRQEIRKERQREREANRQMQIDTIQNELRLHQNHLDSLVSIHGIHAHFIQQRVQDWMVDVQDNCNYDLRDAFRGLRGIKNYLSRQEEYLSKNAMKLVQLQKQKEIEVLKEERVKRAIESLTLFKENYPKVMNAGIEQRIELFAKALHVNVENKQTLQQIKQFREQLKTKIDEYEEQQQSLQHVESVFAKALGGTPSTGKDGSSVISGTIEGVPITVSLNKNSNDIHFDTPTDGSCSSGIDALLFQLETSGVSLGPIQVIKTGATMNNKTSTYSPSSIKA